MVIDFYNRNGGGGGGTADAAKLLEAQASLPASGTAGDVIATNIAEHQEWMDLEDFKQSGWTGVRGICSEDTWLNIKFDGHENRYNGSFNGSEWINGGPEEWYSGWNVTWDGNNWTATNNDWLSVTGTTDGDTWQIDFSIATSGVNDGWDIPSNTEVYLTIPQTVGLYQANSAGTYVNALGNAEYADEADFAREATAASWGFFIRNAEGQPWNDLHHNYEQRENDMFFQGNLLQINKNGQNIPLVFSEQNIPSVPLAPVSAAPITSEEGIVYAIHNSGETSVKQALGEDTSVDSWESYDGSQTGYTKFRGTDYHNAIQLSNDSVVRFHFTGGAWDSDNCEGYTITYDGTSFTADINGITANGSIVDGYGVVELVGGYVIGDYGGDKHQQIAVHPAKYQTAVMSEQGIGKIVKLSQAEYDALVTKDANTIYVII